MKTLGLIIISFLFFVSCKKTNEKLLIGSWKVEKTEYAADGKNFVEEESCASDDVWTFTKDNKLEINQGLTCAGAPTAETTWHISDNDQTIVYVYKGYEGEYYSTITELTKKTYVEEFETGEVNNSKRRITFSKY